MSSNNQIIKNSEWNITGDIYDIVSQIDKLKARYIDDQEETTLALGIFGFITDTEAKKIQTATIMAGELGNEMFASRAKLDKNVLTHAIYTNIEDINAIPAHITLRIGVREDELQEYISAATDNSEVESFTFDHTNSIFIGNYEFHFDYDIILRRVKSPKALSDGEEFYIYTALYDINEHNNLSSITTPYIHQPIVQIWNNYRYIFFEATVHQISIGELEDTIISNSIIDNRSFVFTFTDQLADFEVYIKDEDRQIETRLTPYFYGSPIENGVTRYCWYLYINENTIRVSFDPNSYIPGLNSTIRLKVKTTLGASGNFKYNSIEQNSLFVEFASEYTSNRKLTAYIECATDSVEGKDKKSTEELKELIPKMALSRGYITTETDLNNYFNLISTDQNRLKLLPKVDNQLQRIWYAYFVLKDIDNNIIPSNTIPIKVSPDDEYMITDIGIDNNTRYIIPTGTTFVYSRDKGYGKYIKPEDIPEPFSEEYYDEREDKFYYRNIYNIVINTDPLYAAYYMTIMNRNSYFEYEFVNQDCGLGFVTIRNHFERGLLYNEENPNKRFEYRFTFTIAQSINDDFGLVEVDSFTKELISIDIRCFLILYQDGEPYRYIECEYVPYSYDKTNNYSTSWIATLNTDDAFDSENKIKLTNLTEVGFNSINYGFFKENVEAKLYICARFDKVYMDPDRRLDIIPGLQVYNEEDDTLYGYSLVDVYSVHEGIQLYNNYTDVINTRVRRNVSEDGSSLLYDIIGVPMVGEHFFDTVNRDLETAEEAVTYFVDELEAKKNYIDYCLRVIENTMNIDYKLFNTYGPSYTYTVGYNDDIYVDHVDLTLTFKVKLNNANDKETKQEVINWIKEYVEDVYEMGHLHFPNLIHDAKEYFNDSIQYIDFRYFNDKDLGENHIHLQNPDSPHIVPEFLNVRNKYNAGKTDLLPCIDILIVE